MIAMLFVFASCSRVPKPIAETPVTTEVREKAEEAEEEQEGVASYYASKFNGRKTASGERYDESRLTAAHRTLPFGTRVRVTHLESGKSVEVRINDRGPVSKKRMVDLSKRAAELLGMIQAGLAHVRLEVLDD
ncbi:MAG: septal ring lytic transglycosylase RlpA family protein [Candidatus Eiseniibacteriota bacterium]